MDESKKDSLRVDFYRKNEVQTERIEENHGSWSRPPAGSLQPPVQQVLHTSGHIADLDNPQPS